MDKAPLDHRAQILHPKAMELLLQIGGSRGRMGNPVGRMAALRLRLPGMGDRRV